MALQYWHSINSILWNRLFLTHAAPLCYGSRLKPLPVPRARYRSSTSLLGTITRFVCHPEPRRHRALSITLLLGAFLCGTRLPAQNYLPVFPAPPPSVIPSPNPNVRVFPPRPGAP